MDTNLGNIDNTCEKSPLREHVDIIDPEDRRFYTCRWCNRTIIRTDEDYLRDIGKMDKLELEEEE